MLLGILSTCFGLLGFPVRLVGQPAASKCVLFTTSKVFGGTEMKMRDWNISDDGDQQDFCCLPLLLDLKGKT